MLLAAGSNAEFVQSFLGIFALVAMQLTVLTIIGTVIVHYIEKKKKRTPLPEEQELNLLSPQQFHYKIGAEDYIGFDHSGLFREYKLRLAYSYARNKIVLQDLKELENKYARLLQASGGLSLSNLKNKDMETTNELETTIQSPTDEKKAWLAQLEELNKTIKSLTQENESLLEQLSISNAPENEKELFLNRLQNEKKELKKKLLEQEWLQEAMNEKKAEIGFLQEQLEQRIRAQHTTELEKREIASASEELRKGHEEMITQRDDLENLLKEKNEAIIALNRELQPVKEHIAWLENQLRELNDQNEIVHAAAADSRDEVADLQGQLSRVLSALEMTEQKLSSNKKLMRRLYNEFSHYMEDPGEQSPVIPIEAAL